ncbi:MAG: MBL fold metallo-hydrolase [Alphaproteobacteria bacterium]|nr:MBL fold metallo-hydrolase [Alphaproteobacteria bacterium]
MSGLAFERELEFAHGRADQVSPLIRRIVCNNPGPFTFTGTGTYIVGQDSVAVIDPGPIDDAHYGALLADLDGKTVSHIIITHTHVDHSPLAARLMADTGAKTYAYGPHGSGRARQVESGDVRLDASGDSDFAPDITVAHGDVIEGAGWSLEAVFTPGHTSNHMAFALREENALFSGDHVMAWSTSVIAPPDGNMSDYFASLQTVLGRDDEIYWPTHGPPKKAPRDFVRGFVTHRKMREEAIYRRIQKGDRTIGEIVKAVYSEVDPKLHPAAAMSTFAHIEHLLEREKVVTDGAPTLVSEYRVK